MELITKYKYILKEPCYNNWRSFGKVIWKHKEFSTGLASHLETVVETKTHSLFDSEKYISYSPKT